MAGGTGAFQAKTLLPGFLLDIIALNAGATSLACGGTSTYYSNSFFLRRGMTFGWEVKMSSGGIVAVTIELEQANQPPNTEGAQDDAFTIPINKGGAAGLFPSGNIIAAGTFYKTAYSPIASALGRLKITGTGANDASTALALARVYEIKNF